MQKKLTIFALLSLTVRLNCNDENPQLQLLNLKDQNVPDTSVSKNQDTGTTVVTENKIIEAMTKKIQSELNTAENKIETDWLKIDALIKRSESYNETLKENEKLLTVGSKLLTQIEENLLDSKLQNYPNLKRIQNLITIAKNKQEKAIMLINQIRRTLENSHNMVEKKIEKLKDSINKINKLETDVIKDSEPALANLKSPTSDDDKKIM